MIEWVDQLPRAAREKRKAALDELATRPGEWAIIESYIRQSPASEARRYLRRTFKNVECCVRKHDGQFNLYARIVP